MASYPYWDYKTQSWRNRKAPKVKGRGLDIFDPLGSYRFDEAVKRKYIERPARRKRKTAAQQVRAQVVQKIGTAKTFRELKASTYKALRLLDESLPQVFVCRVRARRRKTRPKRGR
jgi:hypothetical protein